MKMMKYFALAMGSIFSTLFVLSSCTVQTTPSLLTATSNTADATTAILTNVPFAYDVAMDTISYNSCSVAPGVNSAGTLHGLKIGANGGFVDSTDTGAVKAGIKLNSAFLQYIAQNVDVAYPNTTVVPSQIQYILENSDKNKDLTIQYAVRSTTNLWVVPDLVVPPSPVTYQVGRDGIYENANLAQDPVLTNLTKNVVFGPNKTIAAEGPRVYNLGTTSSPDPLEGSLGYTQAWDDTYPPQTGVDDNTGAGENYADNVRAKFNNGQQVLAVTFGNQSVTTSSDTSGASFGLNSPRRPDENNLAKAYGKSYALTFVTKSAAVSSQRRNILANVVEKNLETGTPVPGASWSCENYVIMKTNQWNNKKATEPGCSEISASDLADPTFGPALKARIVRLRRHYPDSLWGIGFMIRENTVYNPLTRLQQPICVVNKSVDCYLPTTQVLVATPDQDIGVNYSSSVAGNTSECYLSRYSQMGVTYTGNKTGDAARLLGRCPQYASICVRTSTSY
ncbi:MAG: hypothetical protein ACXWQQ_05975 [Pseudobdellovibrio sp.]